MHLFDKAGSGNHTCPVVLGTTSAEPVLGTMTFHHIILIVGIACTGITLLFSLLLQLKHLHRYTCPKEQRQIIRIIGTPVVFSVISLLSLASYSAAPYLQPLADLYEAFALASLFLLFVEFVCPDERGRQGFFYNVENVTKSGHVTPGGSLRWFNISWVTVFLFIVAKVVLVVAQEITQATGIYCATSNKLYFAHIWITILSTIAVAFAVLAVFKFYARFKKPMGTHSPLAKLVSFKLIVFLSVVQNLVFTFLNSRGHLNGTSTMTHLDLSQGIPALCLCVEAVGFSIFFHYSYRAREYHPNNKPHNKRSSFCNALGHALNPADLFQGIMQAFRILFTLGRGPAYSQV